MKIIERLATCEKITEWVGLNDPRLVKATGEPAPNGGASLRENWSVGMQAENLRLEIARLLVPLDVELNMPVTSEFDVDVWGGETRNRVLVNFGSGDDWLKCFPLGEASRIPTSNDDWRAWAGVALCDQAIGLAVFADEIFENTAPWESMGVQARIQPVPDAMLERILST